MKRLHLYTVTVLFPALLVFVIFYALDMYLMCGKDIIQDVCQLYKQNAVTGSLCEDICVTKTITPSECMTTSPEKVVYKATWHKKDIILKRMYANTENIISFTNLHDEKDFKNAIKVNVDMFFGECENCSKLFDKIVNIADTNKDGQLSSIETKTILQLLSTQEPAMLIILNGSKVSLDFYGYCGPLYAIQKLAVVADNVYGLEWQFADLAILPNIFEPLEVILKKMFAHIMALFNFQIVERQITPLFSHLKSYAYKHIYRARIPSLRERFNFVRSHLDGIYSLSNNTYGLVQACDSHLGNFGLTEDNMFKALDYDMIYPQHYLQRLLASKPCNSDKDCVIGDFLECTSTCNKTTGFCNDSLRHQMIHNVCPSSFPLIFRNLHIDFQNMNETVLKCLENSVISLGYYCSTIPIANDTLQLYSQVEDLKSKIVNITLGRFGCDVSGGVSQAHFHS